MTRGYTFTATWGYIDKHHAEARSRIIEQLSPGARAEVGTYKDIEFYPAEHWCEILRAIASLANGDEAKAEHDLVAVGEYIAQQATNTFLRLIMRVLTPTLFAKKVPSLWGRDNTRGTFTTDVSEADNGRLRFRLSDIGGLDHVSVVAKGFISFAMKTMGRPPKSMTVAGWSLAQPGPDEVEIDVQLP